MELRFHKSRSSKSAWVISDGRLEISLRQYEVQMDKITRYLSRSLHSTTLPNVPWPSVRPSLSAKKYFTSNSNKNFEVMHDALGRWRRSFTSQLRNTTTILRCQCYMQCKITWLDNSGKIHRILHEFEYRYNKKSVDHCRCSHPTPYYGMIQL